VDNYSPKGQKEFLGKIIQPFENVQSEKDYIIIASNKYENDIKNQIEGYGFCKDKNFSLYSEMKECLFDE